jgi:hydroxymethylbilane synthase
VSPKAVSPEAVNQDATSPRVVRIGTRGSALARTQTQAVAALIERASGWQVELVTIRTDGDDYAGPLHTAKVPGLFVSALRHALLAGDVDVIVHSMKDLPSEPVPGVTMGACPERADHRDALVSRGSMALAHLPAGARIGTGSPRRAARLRRLRPDIEVVAMRGNVDTRISKVMSGEYDAAILAVAGINRLGRESEITQVLDVEDMVPAPAQGALAVECRGDDAEVAAMLATIDHHPTRITTTAERAVLTAVGATCATALGAYASLLDGRLQLIAEVSGEDLAQHAVAEQTIDLDANPAVAALHDHTARAYDLGLAVGRELLRLGAGAYVVPLGSPARSATRRSSAAVGRPVLLVRGEIQDDRDAPALRERGLEVVQDPYINVVPATDPQAAQRARETLAEIADGSAWFIVSSRAALRALIALTSQDEVVTAVKAGVRRGLRSAAVGDITAEAMHELGLHNIVVPDQFSAEALVAELASHQPARAILPRGNIAMRGLVEGLREGGWEAVEQVVYETSTVSERPVTADGLAAGEFSAVVLRSPSAVRAVAHFVPHVPVDTALVCGGRTTAGEVARTGLGLAAVATSSTATQVADLVADIVGDRSPA